MDINKTKDLVERLLENVKDEVTHKTLPEKRLIIDDLDTSKYEDRIRIFNIYDLPAIFSDSIQEVTDDYNSKLKVMAVSTIQKLNIKGLSRVDVGSNYLSSLNPRVLKRYKNMSLFSERLTKKLIEYKRLSNGDILAVSEKGEYIFLTHQNIYMVLRHLNPTFFGLLILISLGEKIVRTAASISYQRNKDYGFPYFMTIVGAVYSEKYKGSPKAKEEFDLQMSDLADLMITLGIKGQEFSTNSSQKIQLQHLSMESMAEIAYARQEENLKNKQLAKDEYLNELAATAELMMDEVKYNPHVSRDQQIYNKTGYAANNTVIKSRFLENIEQYRDNIVKD